MLGPEARVGRAKWTQCRAVAESPRPEIMSVGGETVTEWVRDKGSSLETGRSTLNT